MAAKIPTRLEISAGGVLFRKERRRRQACLIATHGGQRWQLPKGLVERGEPLPEAAAREVAEETGCKGRVVEPIEKIDYWYVWDEAGQKTRRHKIVYFFLLEYTEGSTEGHDREVDAAEWLDFDEAERRLSFADEKKVLRKARKALAKKPRGSKPQ